MCFCISHYSQWWISLKKKKLYNFIKFIKINIVIITVSNKLIHADLKKNLTSNSKYVLFIYFIYKWLN